MIEKKKLSFTQKMHCLFQQLSPEKLFLSFHTYIPYIFQNLDLYFTVVGDMRNYTIFLNRVRKIKGQFCSPS